MFVACIHCLNLHTLVRAYIVLICTLHMHYHPYMFFICSGALLIACNMVRNQKQYALLHCFCHANTSAKVRKHCFCVPRTCDVVTFNTHAADPNIVCACAPNSQGITSDAHGGRPPSSAEAVVGSPVVCTAFHSTQQGRLLQIVRLHASSGSAEPIKGKNEPHCILGMRLSSWEPSTDYVRFDPV